MTSLPDEDLSPWPARLACAAIGAVVCALGCAYLAWLDAPTLPREAHILPLAIAPAPLVVLMHKLGWLVQKRSGRAPGHLFGWAVIASPMGALVAWPIVHALWTSDALAAEDARFAALLSAPEIVEVAGAPLDPTPPPEVVEEPGWVRGARLGELVGRGVVLGTGEGGLHVDRLQLALPEHLRARDAGEVAWIAIARREVIEDAYEYERTSVSPEVEHLELDVRAREGLARLARISAEAVPPERAYSGEASRRYDLPDRWTAEQVAAALGRSGPDPAAPAIAAPPPPE